jgi:glutamate synthase (NADPH/NADH) small chain
MNSEFGFLEYERKSNPYRSEEERLQDFLPLQKELDIPQRRKQAARCMHCGVPFCQSAIELSGMTTGCPLHNLIPEWNSLIAQDHDRQALERLLFTNPFPEFTGRVCPSLCEKACCNAIDSDATSIHDNELYIIETGFSNGWMEEEAKVPARNGMSAAVIGSGPAGLAAAYTLNQRGYSVTVYEKEDRPGGLLMYGIPNMKLDKNVVLRRIDLMKRQGITFICGITAGKDITLEELQNQYDAIILAAGSKKPRALAAADMNTKGIYYAVDFLKAATRNVMEQSAADAKSIQFDIDAKDKCVVIVGGGDTGNDCVATVLRQGAAQVIQLEIMKKPPLERAQSNPWPQWPRNLKTDYGQQEALYQNGSDPRIFESTVTQTFSEDGVLKAVEIAKLDANFNPIEESKQTVACDLLLIAAGFVGVEEETAAGFPAEMSGRNTFSTHPEKKKTSLDKTFACGDCRRGQSLVVWAIREGLECAREVDLACSGYTGIPKV